jgi:ribonuclease D
MKKGPSKTVEDNRFSYELIETLPRLETAARILGQAAIIGVDLEADSLYHYYEKVCLLQITTESASFILDPLGLEDLSDLSPIFSNPRIRKVFHGADYDIRSLYRDFRIRVENLFDTQLACKFLGLRETGLEAVLRSRFQVELNKKFQRADWSQRPFSPEMLEYAALDGRYLIPLARMLQKELEEKDRLSWVEEECQGMAKVRFGPSRPAPLYLKVKGAALLDPKSLAVLDGLLKFREARAQKSDLPPFKILRNEILLDLAIKKPVSLEEMEKEKALSPKQIDRYGTGLLREINRAMVLSQEDLPVVPRESRPNFPAAAVKRIKALKKWRDRQAKELELEPGTLLNNALINAVALENPRSLRELEEIPGMKKWLITHFGREILTAQRGGLDPFPGLSKNLL